MKPKRFLAVLLLLSAPLVRAQLELKADNINPLYVPQTASGSAAVPYGPSSVTNPPPTPGQFAGVGQVAGAAGPISTSATHADRYPANGNKSLVLSRASIGSTFVSGAPRYFMGDLILPPLTQADGVTPAPQGYWRAKPILPGEVISGSIVEGTVSITSPNAKFPLTVVNVTSASTNSATVVVTSTAGLLAGYNLLGQPITRIAGNTITLAGNANANVTNSTPFQATPPTLFYYSPHADKVFAHQAGRVAITWVTSVTHGGVYHSKTETFAVSSAASRPARTIFWTEGSFDGPKVQITDNRITTVNPVFNNQVPKAVAEEVSIPGYSPITPNLSTLYFDKYNGVGQIHAYNVEGRIFIEFLGNVRVAPAIYQHLGTEIVDIRRVPQITELATNLGSELLPHDGDGLLEASPLLSSQQAGSSFYGTSVRANNTTAYYAERETSPADYPDDSVPKSEDAYNKVIFYWMERASFSILWPKFQDRYWQRWSPNLSDYAHYTVDTSGSTPDTGISFTGGTLPQIIYQDDTAQTEAKIDLPTQRLHMTFRPGTDTRNRTLLKFTNSTEVWYLNLYSQAENRSFTRSLTATGTDVLTFPSGTNLDDMETGMVVTGPGIDGSATIVDIWFDIQAGFQRILLSKPVQGSGGSYHFTVQADSDTPIETTATVGSRLIPPAGHELAGYVSSGTSYYPAGYINPFVAGVEAANAGAVIPVNAKPGNNLLHVRWFRKVQAPTASFRDLYVPGKTGRYTVAYPATTAPEIIIAQGVGTDDLPPAESTGSVYVQNNPALPGFNPNEEHSFMLGGRAYALRDDLNIISGAGYTSQPLVLIAYTDPADDRPAMHAYKVKRTNTTYDFDYTATAGTLLIKPYPLPLLPLPLTGSGTGLRSRDIEILGADTAANATVASEAAYHSFTFQDRKGFTWVHRGPHAGGSPTLSMQLYYVSQDGFYIPGAATQPPEGTILPFLRRAGREGTTLNLSAIDKGQTDEPITVVYRPTWPEQAPELRVAETLALPKFGLPQVRGQRSAQILYQQSIANAASATGSSKGSVVLHDPTREKTIALDAPGVGLTKIPATILTTQYRGKTYFQGLPPNVQQRIFMDPARGAKGSLVFMGSFHDEIAGEDYYDLNVLTLAEENLLKGLAQSGDPDRNKWLAAIDALNTRVETFKENPALAGTFVVDALKNADVGENDSARINSPDTAVDSYAVTATGQGTGFVTMVFGNGYAFTNSGDPVQVKIFKVAPQLYVGDLKVVSSSNPLDEQVTLRHSGDFAGKPEDYEYEWRWTTGAATAPAVYNTTMTTKLGIAGVSDQWRIVSDPGRMMTSSAQYAAVSPVGLPRTLGVNPEGYTNAEKNAGYPALMLKSLTDVDFTSGVPGTIIFSADMGDLDGFVLYVNGVAAVASGAPASFPSTNSSTGLSVDGLTRQFEVAASYFRAGSNNLEIAVYSGASSGVTSSLNFRLEATEETDAVLTGTVWQSPTDPQGVLNTNTAIVGGSPLNPFGGSTFVLNDRWFTMRYRPKANANNVLGTPWSRWMPPQFVEGWVKRVLAAINPFEQRVKDLLNSGVNTDVSLLTQAGKRWEGDIALNLDNIDEVGLIEIYETVLNRAKAMSIDANTNDPDSNNALILAAGYLNDLYTLLGHESYADAANPTISLDDADGAAEVNTSRFSFEGQVASSLDEELSLLRGRDDFVSPGVGIAPAYNRLFWNYTRGINGGEAIYALNYNIKEKVGSATANGVIDESDAQRMFPQGHGDAYGHYLTALTGYYKLLTNPNFTWTPRAEAVSVLGQPVTVDYFDERKFAAAAGNVARSAQQIIALTWRQNYRDDPASGWTHFRDDKPSNPQTGVTRRQGVDEWVSRASQGSLYHWAVANSLLPVEDLVHTGIQKIDRTTVPEIQELASLATTFQASIDNANAHLNPLGLSPGAIAFDIAPASIMINILEGGGASHYQQIAERALTALNNAAGSFNQAARMTGSLRNQENGLDEFNTALVEQERAFQYELIDLFGRPYTGEVGPGKLYAQNYSGPDLAHWFIVDRPSDMVDTSQPVTVNIKEAINIDSFVRDRAVSLNVFGSNPGTTNVQELLTIPGIMAGFNDGKTVTARTVRVTPSQYVQYNDIWKPGGLGSRPETGEIQDALIEAQLTLLSISDANVNYQKELASLRQSLVVFDDMVRMHTRHLSETKRTQATIIALESVVLALETTGEALDQSAQFADGLSETLAEFFPRSVGLASDVTSGARGAAQIAGDTIDNILSGLAIVARAAAGATGIGILNEEQQLENTLTALGFSHEEIQFAWEFSNAYRNATTHAHEIMALTIEHQRAVQNVSNILARGSRILAEREVFRQRAAAVIQGYRTRDVSFRLFRNEALEQYRSLFDLASRYTYLAAKSYDYETGLLGTPQGQDLFSKIVNSRALGDLTDGEPRLTTSTLGDGGLASSMARLNADFSVAEGRLGINNPDQNGTVFSLRGELYRILNNEDITGDDEAWRQTLEQHMVANVMSDPDVASQCRNIRKPNGTPVPGIIISFSTTIQHGKNFFGLDYLPGDHNFTPSNYATRIFSVGVALPGYVGMDVYNDGAFGVASSISNLPNALGATPYCYLIPCGSDFMLAPPLGDTNSLRSWKVRDQALPLPFNLGANDFNGTQFFGADGSLSEQPWILRKHQAFRVVDEASMFWGDMPMNFTSSRLIGRSVWNGQWKIVIPAYTLHSNEQEGLNRFAASVSDIQLYLKTYSNSGN